jgi:indole-3-acetate monooxygenase
MNDQSTPSAVVQTAASLADRLAASSAESEQLRHLAPDAIAALTDTGLFHLLVPEDLGGHGASMLDALDAIEHIAAADGSAGWCLLKGASSNMIAGYLDHDVARSILPDRHTVIAGNFNPTRGKAVPVDGGYRLSGRWDWATGVDHSQWFIAGALVPPANVETPPTPIAAVVPRSSISLIDTWNSPGMSGTGSCDVTIDDVVVPAEHTFAGLFAMPVNPDPIYAVPLAMQVMVPHGALAIGIARGALTAFESLAVDKTPLNSMSALRSRPSAQDAAGRAYANIASARAYLRHAVEVAWSAPAPHPSIGLDLSLAATQATALCCEAVDLLHRSAGGTVASASHPIARAFRDIHVAASHYTVNTERFSGAGRVIFGDSPSPLAP